MGTPLRPSSRKRGPPSEDDAEVSKRRRAKVVEKENYENEAMAEEEEALDAGAESSVEDTMTSPLAERRRNEVGKPPEAGIIQTIYCENFMCHRKLTVNLCRNVNFIYGQNGSGKSAILAAIQICLGAGARRTNRARNLKDLVRKDSTGQNAKIRVTLLNRGLDGYHHEKYGDTITVERTIAVRGGYNGYKLYDENMVEQSRSKKDLDDMLDKLNIQVENPVAILDQEEAKKFLTGKPSDKYNFFMKATELERIDRSYSVLIDKKSDLEKQSVTLHSALASDMELVEKTKKAYEQHQEIEKLESKLLQYQEAYSWALHQEEDQALQEEEQRVKDFREKAAKKLEELTQAEEEANKPDEVSEAKRNKIDDLSAEANDQANLKRELEADLKRASEPQKAAQRQLKNLGKSIRKAEAELKKATDALHQRREEIIAKEGSAESEAAKRTQRLEAAESKLAAAREKRDELKQAESDSRRAYDELEPHAKQAKDNASAAQGKANAIMQRLRALKSSSGNKLSVFGPKVPQVKKSVDAAIKKRRFKGPVVGPIGQYVQIYPGKEQFAPIAELSLGPGTLDRWIVTNDHDRKIFMTIRREARCNNECGVFQVAAHRRYNVPPPPVDGIDTVATVLKISDDLVFNCLVDNCKIEERAVSTSKEDSEKALLKRNENGQYSIVGGKIKNVFFLPRGDNWALRNGNININSNEKQLRRTIGVDQSAAIAATEQEVDAVDTEVKELKKEESKKEIELLGFQKTWNKAKQGLRNNEKEIDRCVKAIDEIKSEEVDAANIDTDTTEYEQEVQEAQDQVQKLTGDEKSLREQIEDTNPQIREIQARLKENNARNAKVLQDMEKAELELAEYIQHQSKLKDAIERKREKMKKYEDVVAKQNQKVNDIQANVDKYLETARRLAFQRTKREERKQQEEEGDQPEDSQFTQDPTNEDLEAIEVKGVNESCSFYEAKIKRVERKIDQERERREVNTDDPVIAYEKYKRAKKQANERARRCQEVDNLAKMLLEDVKTRRKRWKQFRNHISHLTDTKFDEMLNQKGSSGGIDFAHTDQELHLTVQKDSRDQNSQQRDVKALSGGERSFTTIALLLALGESLETPFRVLDEFDVFLDPVSRKLVIESLIQMAKNMEHRQFIFITPQDVSNVEVDPMLKILKMTPPARNEVAGGLTQQTLDYASQP